jgi:hypothetical protein
MITKNLLAFFSFHTANPGMVEKLDGRTGKLSLISMITVYLIFRAMGDGISWRFLSFCMAYTLELDGRIHTFLHNFTIMAMFFLRCGGRLDWDSALGLAGVLEGGWLSLAGLTRSGGQSPILLGSCRLSLSDSQEESMI